MANGFVMFPPPVGVGFVANQNLDLPLYIVSEVHTIVTEDGQLLHLRRPRPLSVISGAEFVLQCDQELLMRYII
jgi:hypothetical protein